MAPLENMKPNLKGIQWPSWPSFFMEGEGSVWVRDMRKTFFEILETLVGSQVFEKIRFWDACFSSPSVGWWDPKKHLFGLIWIQSRSFAFSKLGEKDSSGRKAETFHVLAPRVTCHLLWLADVERPMRKCHFSVNRILQFSSLIFAKPAEIPGKEEGKSFKAGESELEIIRRIFGAARAVLRWFKFIFYFKAPPSAAQATK